MKHNMQKMRALLLTYLLVLWFSIVLPMKPSPNVLDGCREKCGDISIFYPFGLDDPNCAINNGTSDFLLKCNSTTSPPTLVLRENITIVNMSIDDGLISVKLHAAVECYNGTRQTEYVGQGITLGENFRFSHEHNKLTVFGCDTTALLTDRDENFRAGCVSLCNKDVKFEDNESCSGDGCCQASLPESLSTLVFSLQSVLDSSEALGKNQCGIAFLSDQRSFKVADFSLSDWPYPKEYMEAESVIEWVVEETTCEIAKDTDTYACKNNTDCVYSRNVNGYRCLCKQGFAGNPYLHGCQDIDECKDQSKYQCHGHCRNTIGNYTCLINLNE
ncbi:wall-associated receptor kinase 2-like [Euphorbia lathyris]|uniref:wall-associated receptor kinase 2-like n=1 Tax=Euphorbia lathyris TaxID=212925 RepID=UPI003313A161